MSSLVLNAPTPTRRGASAKGCIKCTAIFLFICFSLLFLWFFTIFAAALKDNLLHPHKGLNQNQTWTNVSEVVRPLIDKDQRFDIAASVWIKMLPEEEEEFKKLHPAQADLHTTYYTPLYSDIVFTNLRLSDRRALNRINFTVPTKIFRSANVSQFDLRGTLALIPSSPSPLDRLGNYSYWMPTQVTAANWPRRAWPFPLGSPFVREQNMGEQAMDLLALVIPLVSFHEVPSRCKPTDIDFAAIMAQDNLTEEAAGHLRQLKSLQELAGSLGIKKQHQRHPHIVSRMHIQMVDDTPIFNFKAFSNAHHKLKSTSCGQAFGLPDRRHCTPPAYHKDGPLQMQLELSTEDGYQEWRYAPYWQASGNAAGPMDQIPVPVNLENCTERINSDEIATRKGYFEDAESMNVTWHISFSGRTPGKYLFSQFGSAHSVNNSQTDYEKAMAQSSAELWNSIKGQPFHEDSRPLRRAMLSFVNGLIMFSQLFLVFFYWYTLPSTVGVSIAAAKLFLLGWVSQLLLLVVQQDENDLANWVGLLVSQTIVFCSITFAMIKAIFRIQVGWRWKWIPTLSRLKPSHRERMSVRIDQKIGFTIQLGLVLFFAALLGITDSRDVHIISPLHPPAPSEESGLVVQGLNCLSQALENSAAILQLIMNHRSRTFAGSYKWHAYVNGMSVITLLLEFTPAFVGRHDTRPGLYWISVIHTATATVSTWQALTLPSVELGPDEEEE